MTYTRHRNQPPSLRRLPQQLAVRSGPELSHLLTDQVTSPPPATATVRPTRRVLSSSLRELGSDKGPGNVTGVIDPAG